MNLNCTQFKFNCNCGQKIEVNTHEYENYVVMYAQHRGEVFGARIVSAEDDAATFAATFLADTRSALPYFEKEGCDFAWSQ